MPITSVTQDPEALTLTVVADFAVPVRRLWDAYADPRQIERFWGPPGWPATFTRHDVAVGGRSNYAMTGPDGERSGGYWEFLAVEEGKSFEVLDGFADDEGPMPVDPWEADAEAEEPDPGFLDIAAIVEETLEAADRGGLCREPATLAAALELDGAARRLAAEAAGAC